MARPVLVSHPVSQAFAASGAIALELAPKPFTITRMAIVVRADITTATATNFNDPWDRIIANLSLSGQQKTFFNFTTMRAAYHLTRLLIGRTTKRPTVIANSQTNALQQFAYLFHFGVAPQKFDPASGAIVDNPFDLTAGIPPVAAGNLSLSGAYGAAAAPGTNVTVNDADFDVYLWGVQPEPGDPPELWMPRAFPRWDMRTPTPTATSGAFATSDNIPAGDFLHSMLLMLTNGTNAPRDDGVLGSLKLYNQLESRDIWKWDRYKAAEILTQANAGAGWPPSDDNSTLGVPSVVAVSDEGLVPIPVHQYAPVHRGGHPLYGADLRRVATGDLQLQYGVDDATGVTMDVVYRRYQLNPDHPANAGA